MRWIKKISMPFIIINEITEYEKADFTIATIFDDNARL